MNFRSGIIRDVAVGFHYRIAQAYLYEYRCETGEISSSFQMHIFEAKLSAIMLLSWPALFNKSRSAEVNEPCTWEEVKS
jgi:hypothetical protein